MQWSKDIKIINTIHAKIIKQILNNNNNMRNIIKKILGILGYMFIFRYPMRELSCCFFAGFSEAAAAGTGRLSEEAVHV